jgi:hypothetical protein
MPKNYALFHGDCLEILPLIPVKIDMILADLPYGTTNCKWDSCIDLTQLWVQYHRLCRGAVVLFAQTPFDKVLGVSNLSELRYEWIWEKGNATGHLNSKRAPMKAHENILVFSAGSHTYNPQKTSGHVRKVATKQASTCPVYRGHGGSSYDSTERFPRSVIRFSSDKQRGGVHPTQKPLALCEYLIKTYSNPGDMILDNTMGAGTTGVAALGLGRKFIGIELDKKYFEMAEQRICPIS